MFENPDDISTSGFVPSSGYVVSGRFSEFLELPSRGYCRLFKAQRNGQWFTLKTLKPEVANDPVYQRMLEKEFDLTIPDEEAEKIVTVGDAIAFIENAKK